MFSSLRRGGQICAIGAIVAISGCGGGTGSSAVVAHVGGQAITQGYLDHWMAVIARRQYEATPRGAVPAGVVPDPPNYKACAAFLRAETPTSATAGSLVRQCATEYRSLRGLALGSVITGYWLIDEGKARGFAVTDAEVDRRVAGIVQREYGGEAKFRRYLRITGETEADQRFRARIKLFSAKIEHELLADGSGGQAYLRFAEEFPKKWAPKTTCKAGFVVPNCSEYRGSLKPEAKLL